MRIILTLILSFFIFSTSFADEQRLTTLFKSENKLFSLQYAKKKWQLKDSLGKVKYTIQDRGYTSMTILISNMVSDLLLLMILLNLILSGTFQF